MNNIHRAVAGVLTAAARTRALRAGAQVCVLALGIGSVANAQEAAGNNTPSLMEEVHVTGSRIQVDGMTTPTPVTSLSADDLHVMAPTTLAAAITQLPQFTNSAVPEGAPSSGWTGASGASILNLRGGRDLPAIAIGLIVFGAILLLHTLDLLDFERVMRFWPVLLIGAGVYLLYGRFRGSEVGDERR